MLEIKGKYATAKVFTSSAESGALGQIRAICNLPVAEGCQVRVMPDVHEGKGCVIGMTMEIKDKAIPNMVGVDIGCGVSVAKLKEKRIDLPKIDSIIKKIIPNGSDKVRDREHKFVKRTRLSELRCINSVYLEKAELSLGSLGSGNHFIEIAQDSADCLYILVHSGSRYLGAQVANYYQDTAYKTLNKRNYDSKVEQLKVEYKKGGRERELPKALENLKKVTPDIVSHMMAYCDGKLFDDYIHDMKIVQEFAELSRSAIIAEIVKAMKLHIEEEFSTIHNYVDTARMILRKGAVSAQAGEKLIIPINNEDGSLLCIGKGNPDWNYSAPHGAGRLMSRSEAKKAFVVGNIKKSMKAKGVYTTSICNGTVDECAGAYKPLDSIVENIGDTVDIIDRLYPIYNFKAGGEE